MIDINFILLVIVQVLCVFIFLCLFFFTYASKKEGDILNSQVNFLINDIAEHNIHLLPNDKKQALLNTINGIKTDTSQNTQAAIDIINSNNKIKAKTKKIILYLCIIVVLIISISYKFKNTGKTFFKNLNLKHIFKETGIIIFFIAITEYIFLNYFAAQYISVKPNILKAQVFENISKGFSS